MSAADKGQNVKLKELAGIDIESGVSAFTGEGFCTIRATATDGTVLRGQLDPASMRGMAVDWLEGAEAAETDASINALCKDMGLDDQAGAAMIANLRRLRTGRKSNGR